MNRWSLLSHYANRWQQMTLARQSKIEAEGVPNDEAEKTREGPGDLRSAKQVSEANRGRVGGSIWQSRSKSFVTCLSSGVVKEAAISLAIGATCSLFVATPIGLAFLFGGIAVQLLVNAAIRIHTTCNTRWSVPTIFSLGSAIHANTLIHEFGHYSAAFATLKNANPIIEYSPYVGGSTRFQISELSKFGQWLGKERVHPFIVGAGPALSCAVSTLLLAIGLGIEQHNSEMGRMLIVSAVVNFLVHALYALSALLANPTNFSHDFVALWAMTGLHPIAAAVAMVAIPILLIAGAAWMRACKMP